MLKLYILTLLTTLTLIAPSLHAAEAAKKQEPSTPAAAVQGQDSAGAEELDINKLKENYWKPKDADQEVVQNKLYTRDNKIEISPMFGVYLRVDFQDAKYYGGSMAYHLNDLVGFEGSYMKIKPTDAKILTTLKATRGASIEFNEEDSYKGFQIPITPIYAKFQLLGKKIGHFDLYVAPGFGFMKTKTNHFSFTGAVGQRFYITTRLFLKIEYKFISYKDHVDTAEGITALKNNGPGFYEDRVNDHMVTFGLSLLLF